MERNMKQWVGELIASPDRAALPIMTHSGIELIGHSVRDAVTDGEVHARAVLALAERYPSLASTVIMDLTVEAEAFGAEIHFPEDDVPSVVGRLVCDRAGIEALAIPSLDAGRVPEYLKANELVARASDRPVLSGCIGPYSLAGRLYDMSEIMMGIYIEPDTIRLLLDKCTEFITEYCKALKRAGSNGVLIAEPAAGLLSDDACREFSSVYVRRIVEQVQDDNFAVILHNCGNTGQCTAAMVATGSMGYHFGNGMDMAAALRDCPSDTLVMGNVDPVSVFKMGTPEQVYEASTALLEMAAGHPNFILSSGCDTPPGVPTANIEAFYRAVADFNGRKR